MGNKLRRLPKATFILGAATVGLWCLPHVTYAQTSTPQDRQAVPAPQDRQGGQSDDITRRDLARFDQFLDSHRDVADQLRKTPSLIDDPQFLENHPELNQYLQDHPSVKQEISQNPDTFMRLEDRWNRDASLRDHDAGWQDRNDDHGNVAYRDDDQNRNGDHRDAMNGDNDRGDVASFARFLDGHREIAEQVRKDPSLLDNRDFLRNHPELETYFRDNPGVRDQLRQDPNAFMRQEDAYDRESNLRDHDTGGQDRDPFERNVANFDRFLDGHREIAEQVRKDPSLCDNRDFVRDHPDLQAFLEDNPGVRDQLKQDPNAFMHREDAFDRDSNMRDHDPMHDHMADFGGFLRNHSEIQSDLERNPSMVKDHEYVQNHAELDAYLSAHPDVRAELMANPENFVHGAQQYTSPTGTPGGAGVSGRGTTGTTGSAGTGTTGSMTGASTNPTTTHEPSKPNQ
jgi:hypothetical protein